MLSCVFDPYKTVHRTIDGKDVERRMMHNGVVLKVSCIQHTSYTMYILYIYEVCWTSFIHSVQRD